MPHDEEFIGEFWINLMVAAGMYDKYDTLKNIINYHEKYINELKK